MEGGEEESAEIGEIREIRRRNKMSRSFARKRNFSGNKRNGNIRGIQGK